MSTLQHQVMTDDQMVEQSGKWEMGKEKEREVRKGKECAGHRKRKEEGKERKEEEKEKGRRSYAKEEGDPHRCQEEEEKEWKKRKK